MRRVRVIREAVRLAVGTLLVSIAWGATSAQAGGNDFSLRNGKDILFRQDANGRYQTVGDTWKSFATELGYALAPRLASPAETLGHAGFHVSALWSGTWVSDDKPYWSITERGLTGDPASILQTLQLEVRKGLPFSFEVGFNFSWLADSSIFSPGLEVRWAFHEGYRYIPDFAIRGSVNHMVGVRDMLLTTVGVDLAVSKSFGLFGSMSITPYLSWAILFISADSRVIDPTPEITSDEENNLVLDDISPTSRLHHRLTMGFRTLYSRLNISVQGELQMFGEQKTIGPVATISTKLGLDF